MSGRKSKHHTVTLTREVADEGTEDEFVDVHVAFTCTAGEDAGCRRYPDFCDCEFFIVDKNDPDHDTGGHVILNGQECWLKGWFDNDAVFYVGDDASHLEHRAPLIEKTGRIKVEFDDCDSLVWSFK